jgi:Ca-activated chloride channel family protein
VIRLAFVLLLAAQLFGGGERNTREGAEHFEAGRLEEALRAFSRAEGEHPEAPENDLNIAGVHYRLGESAGAPTSEGEGGPLAEALRGYQAALQGGVSGEVRRDAYYNLANTLFRAGAFREAAAAYGEAIALDPEDRDARQNLERALRAADEEEQGNGGQGPGEQPPEPGEEQRDEDDQDRDDQDREGQGRQDPREQRQDRPEDQESGEEPSPPEGAPEPRDPPSADDAGGDAPADAGPDTETPDSAPGAVPEISPEQAERILAALADIERAFQEERLEKRRARALRRGRH